MGQLLPFFLHEAIREGDGRVAPQTNPPDLLETVEEDTDEVRGFAETRCVQGESLGVG